MRKLCGRHHLQALILLFTVCSVSAIGQQVPHEAFGENAQVPDVFPNMDGSKLATMLDQQRKVITIQTNVIKSLDSRLSALENRVDKLEKQAGASDEQ